MNMHCSLGFLVPTPVLMRGTETSQFYPDETGGAYTNRVETSWVQYELVDEDDALCPECGKHSVLTWPGSQSVVDGGGAYGFTNDRQALDWNLKKRDLPPATYGATDEV